MKKRCNENADLSISLSNPTTNDNAPEIGDFQFCEEKQGPSISLSSPSSILQIAPARWHKPAVCKASNNTRSNIDDVYSCYK